MLNCVKMSTTTATVTIQSPPISMDYTRNIFNDKPEEPQSSTAQLSPVVQMDNNIPSSANQQKCSYHRQCTRTADVHHHHPAQHNHPVQNHHPVQPQPQQPCAIALAARVAVQGQIQIQLREQQQQDEQIQQQYLQQQQQQLQSPPQPPSTASTYARRLVRQHQQLLQQSRLNNTDNTSAVVAANHITRDAISTNVLPQLNAALLQERYLLLELVDGSSFYKCVDITTQKSLVCKVSVFCL